MSYPGSLHNHTEYSNLRLRDSINTAKELIDYAIELGHKVIAITEHDCVSNAIKVERYYEEVKKQHPDFKLIRGNEIYLIDPDEMEAGDKNYYHFILLAKDAIGHQQIRELSTRAWMRSTVDRRMRRVPTYYSDLQEIIAPNPGHVIASTACLGGWLAKHILKMEIWNEDLAPTIENWLEEMEGIFGEDDFYLEMQPSASKEQQIVNEWIRDHGYPFIITTDSHYLKKEDAALHEAYLNSQDGDREVASFYATTYMMGTEELESYFSKYMSREQLDVAYQYINEIADKCEDYSLLKALKIPRLVWNKPKRDNIEKIWFMRMPWLQKFVDSEYEGDRILALMTIDAIKAKPDELMNNETYLAVDDCLEKTWVSSEVNKAHWSAYFLNLQRIIEECWNAGTLVGCGRGSGVGFILLYLLDIIQINPKRESTETFSFRFLNPNRVSVLDIDTDIEGGRRGQVLSHLREVYGEDRVANVATFRTEASKAAIQTACRGLGIDVDKARELSALIPSERGQAYSLSQCYYGDPEKDIRPVTVFKNAMNEYPEVWNVAQRIEGLVCGYGIHAGGVIFVDEPFTNSTALMRAPDGTIETAFDLHDDEAVSLIKMDLLSVEALDKIHNCLDLLVEHGHIKPGKDLKETYENTIGIYNLERTAPEMWKMVWEHKIASLFQMEQQSGIQGIALTKPTSVDELAVLNSVIRLMAQEKGAESPLNKFARFKANKQLWYDEMDRYGLTKEEQKILEPVVGSSFGIAESQEKIMKLVQIPEAGGFDLSWGDRLRKAVAKKAPKDYLKLEDEYYNNMKEKGLSENFCHYVWDVLVAMSRGYSFNASHCLAYSLIGLQEMNLAFKYPTIYWSTACLIADSGGAEMDEEESKNNDYGKIATAIGKMKAEGVDVVLPDINQSTYTFTPDEKNNQVVYGLRGIMSVGDELIGKIIEGRPYASIKDFYYRIRPKKTSMVPLIKSGAFDRMMPRRQAMAWYIWETCDKKNNLTMNNMPTLIRYGVLQPQTDEEDLARRVYNFNQYLKKKCLAKKGDEEYKLDPRAINFLTEIAQDSLIDCEFKMNVKRWDKVYQKWMDIFRKWMAENKTEILDKLNFAIFSEDWTKYSGEANLSQWEMDAVGYYQHEHELAHVNMLKYGIANFEDLPEDPMVVTFKKDKNGRVWNTFKLEKICGTCISKNKNKGTVTILTTSGAVVLVKFRKEYFAMYDKQVSMKNPDGSKTILERSWFNKGNKIMVMGFRSGDDFIPKKYTHSVGEQLYHIDAVDEKGNLVLRHERMTGDMEDDED